MPSLPPKIMSLTADQDPANDRALSLQHFLDEVCGNRVFLYAPELEMFLLEPENDLLSQRKPQ